MEWDENPRFVIPDDCFEAINLWYSILDQAAWDSGSEGAASIKWLPEPGGMNDQVNALMDAFLIISSTVRQLRDEHRASTR